MLCRCVCVKESMYERESVGERKDVRKSVGGALLPFLGFFGSFCPKSFFLISCFFFLRVVCVFFALFDVFVSRCTWIEKSASNAEKQTQRTQELLSSESNTSSKGE